MQNPPPPDDSRSPEQALESFDDLMPPLSSSEGTASTALSDGSPSRLPLRGRLHAWWRAQVPVFLPNALCFFSSMAIMVLELVAGRLVANQVGSSQYTWTSIIAVILAGMSLGNWWGGRIADRPAPLVQLERLFLGAALSVQLCLPLSYLLGLGRDSALPLVVHHPEGSSYLWGFAVLGMMTFVFLLPAIQLGMLSPVLARLALDAHRQTGRAIGSVYSWGAIGSILGVMGSGFVLVSLLPVKVILAAISVVMLLLSAAVWRLRHSAWLALSPESTALSDDPGAPDEAGGAGSVTQAPPVNPNESKSLPDTAVESSHTLPERPFLSPYAIIALSSFCLMVVEMVAGRMVSRNVGSSIYTWTIVIGVIFAGMSLGNYVGGRLASRPPFQWSLSRLTSRLLLLASMLTFSILWTAPQLDKAMRPVEWPGGGHFFEATLGYPPRALQALREDGVPESALKAIETAHFQSLSEELFKLNLKEVLGSEIYNTHQDSLLREARLMGDQAMQLREEGVPDEVIEAMRASINRSFLRGLDFEFEARLRNSDRLEGYSKDDRYAFLTTLQARLWRPSLFVFPVRLLVLVLLVFGGAAFVLGCVSPAVAAMALAQARRRGQTMGNIYAWGAWGSIIGTALAGFFLIRWFGCSLLTALTALTLGLLAVKPDRFSWLASGWLALLGVLTLPLLGQHLEPNALDHVAFPHFNKEAYEPHNPISKLGRVIDEAVFTSDDDVGPNSVESNYQSLQVTYAKQTRELPGFELRKLRLDRLIHGYALLKMPRPDQRFEYDRSEFDPSHLEYDYEVAYALATARSQLKRFSPDPALPGHWIGKPLMSLSLGGGTYTFPRFLLERWTGQTHTVQAGETLLNLLAQYYRDEPSASALDIGGMEGLRELARRVLLAQTLPESPVAAIAPKSPNLDPDAPLAPGRTLWFPALADVVELDPLVTEINYQRLRLKRFDEDARLKTWNYDARNFVDALVAEGWTGRYDVIFGDAFNHYSVPYHLSTVEFNRNVKRLLKPEGVFIANLIDRYGKVRFLSAYVTTLQQLYRHVEIVVEKDRSLRHGRETFVIVASDADIALEFPGGVPARALPFLDSSDLDGLARVLAEDDPPLAAQLRQLRKQPSLDLISMIRQRMQIDFQIVGLNPAPDRIAQYEAEEEEGLRIRRYVAYDPTEAHDQLIEVGRRPTLGRFLRELLPSRLLLPTSPASFEVTDATLVRLKQTECPDDLLDAVQQLKGKHFQDVEALLNAVAMTSAPNGASPVRLLEKNQHLVVRAFKVRPPAEPPLVLTDAFAPVDELLAPLFEDPSTY